MYSWLSLLGNFISVDNYAQHRGYLAQALHRKTIFQWSPNSCQEIYIISNQQCVKHTRFLEIILCSHLLSCLHKHLRFPFNEIKTLLTISSKTKIPTPLCSLLSIAGTLKFAYSLASSGLTKYLGLYQLQVLGCISILWKSFWHPCVISHDWNMY